MRLLAFFLPRVRGFVIRQGPREKRPMPEYLTFLGPAECVDRGVVMRSPEVSVLADDRLVLLFSTRDSSFFFFFPQPPKDAGCLRPRLPVSIPAVLVFWHGAQRHVFCTTPRWRTSFWLSASLTTFRRRVAVEDLTSGPPNQRHQNPAFLFLLRTHHHRTLSSWAMAFFVGI